MSAHHPTEPDDGVLVELGRVTWRAIVLEGLVDSLCATIRPANPREDKRGIGRKNDDARKVLKGWPEFPAGDAADAWLVRAAAALDARNGLLHATALHGFEDELDGRPRAALLLLEPHLIQQPTGISLGVMPRGSTPYAEVPMTMGALEDVAARLEAATERWREVLLATSAERNRQVDLDDKPGMR